MALSVAKYINNAPRQSVQRAAAEMGNALSAFAQNRILTSGGLAIAGTTSKVQNASTITFTIDGAFLSKAATDNLWTPAGSVVAVSSWQKYVLMLNAAGAASVQEGVASTINAASVAWTNISAISDWAPLLTLLNSGKAIAGVLTIATNSSTTFTPGTTALNAAGITATYTNGIDPSLLPLIGDSQATILGIGG